MSLCQTNFARHYYVLLCSRTAVVLTAATLFLSVTLAWHFLQLQLSLCVADESRDYSQYKHSTAQRHYWVFGDRTAGGRGDADDLAERSRRRFEELLQLNASGLSPLESNKWKPVVLRRCTPDMPPYYAPCLPATHPAIEYGEELLYPDFEVALPGFLNRTDAEQWLLANYGYRATGQTGANRRALVDIRQGVLVFNGLRGQNLVYRNVRYEDGLFPRAWRGDCSHCLGHMVHHTQMGDTGPAGPAQRGDLRVAEAAVYVTPADSRYQHFLDHATKPLMQTVHLITNTTLILPGYGLRSKQAVVQAMWGWLPNVLRPQQLQREPRPVFAARAVTGCRTPFVHPYLFLRLQELVLGPDAPRVPLSQRKVVLWYSRSIADDYRGNAGRRILNEVAVKAEIVKLLQERGLGERLEVHHPARFPDPLDYARWVNRHVCALVGPHGGGLHNAKWMAGGGLVLELMPRTWMNEALYAEAYGHGLNYWVDVLDPLDEELNMMASPERVVAVLRAELRKEAARGPLLRPHYDWPAALEVLQAGWGEQLVRPKCCESREEMQSTPDGIYVLDVATGRRAEGPVV